MLGDCPPRFFTRPDSKALDHVALAIQVNDSKLAMDDHPGRPKVCMMAGPLQRFSSTVHAITLQ